MLPDFLDEDALSEDEAWEIALNDHPERCGLSRHEIRHVIAAPLTEQMWYMMKEGCPFDEGRYLAELHETVTRYQSRP